MSQASWFLFTALTLTPFSFTWFVREILDNAWVLRRNAWKHLKLELHCYLYRSLFVSVVCLRSIKSFREDFIFVFLRKCRRRLSIIACCSERVTVVWSAILFFFFKSVGGTWQHVGDTAASMSAGLKRNHIKLKKDSVFNSPSKI